MANFDGLDPIALRKLRVINQLCVRRDNIALLQHYTKWSTSLQEKIQELQLAIRDMRNNLRYLNNLTDQLQEHRRMTDRILTELLKRTHGDLSPYEKRIFWDDVKMRRRNNNFFIRKVKEIGQEIQEIKATLKRREIELLRNEGDLVIANFNVEDQRYKLSQRLYREGENDDEEEEFLDEDWAE